MNKNIFRSRHQPVLLALAMRYLDPKPGERYLDATLGGGSYSYALYQKGAQVLSLDWDPLMIQQAKEHYPCPNASWHLRLANFADLAQICREEKFCPLRGVVFDLGLTKWHYQLGRGFSFQEGAPLDMRLNPELPQTAADIITTSSLAQLEKWLLQIGQEQFASEIARFLKKAVGQDLMAADIAEGIAKIYQRHHVSPRNNPATKTFLVLRILVNREIENLEKGLEGALVSLAPRGRLVVISFHSGEDRLVKQFFRRQEKEGRLKILTKKAQRPTAAEVEQNPLARSACLRAAEKNEN